MLKEVDLLTADENERDRWQERRAKMLEHTVDVSAWYYDLVAELVGARLRRRSTTSVPPRTQPDS
jgi:hypothetical protein